MRRQPLDGFAARLDPDVRASVRESSAASHHKRLAVLAEDFDDVDTLRRVGAGIRRHALDHLDRFLPEAESKLVEHGAHVHYAWDAARARELVLDLLRARGIRRVCKSKSMVTEEIELAPFLAENGIEAVETDLGEFIVQLDRDKPSHIVKPVIHKSREQIARTFEAHGLGAYDDAPEVITRRARTFLREKFLAAQGAISGANFVSAESGRLVIVTNEGNSRFGLAAARVHVALVGIEKVVPRDRDLAVLLNLLARSATGQHFTTYVELVRGPRADGTADGPEEMHVVFLDNGRSDILAGEFRDILRCIRCGACMNVCPVYRAVSGHAYRTTYPGPLGAVLAPLLAGAGDPPLADLPFASSLCGACTEVCPVDIPLADLLARARDRGDSSGAARVPSLTAWAALATRPGAWRAALVAGKLLNVLPHRFVPSASLRTWRLSRTLPRWSGGAFRAWMGTRKTGRTTE